MFFLQIKNKLNQSAIFYLSLKCLIKIDVRNGSHYNLSENWLVCAIILFLFAITCQIDQISNDDQKSTFWRRKLSKFFKLSVKHSKPIPLNCVCKFSITHLQKLSNLTDLKCPLQILKGRIQQCYWAQKSLTQQDLQK